MYIKYFALLCCVFCLSFAGCNNSTSVVDDFVLTHSTKQSESEKDTDFNDAFLDHVDDLINNQTTSPFDMTDYIDFVEYKSYINSFHLDLSTVPVVSYNLSKLTIGSTPFELCAATSPDEILKSGCIPDLMFMGVGHFVSPVISFGSTGAYNAAGDNLFDIEYLNYTGKNTVLTGVHTSFNPADGRNKGYIYNTSVLFCEDNICAGMCTLDVVSVLGPGYTVTSYDNNNSKYIYYLYKDNSYLLVLREDVTEEIIVDVFLKLLPDKLN